jgi:hypothetical protein
VLSRLARLRPGVPPVSVWVAAALLLLSSMIWGALTPATRAPDEVQHLNSIVRLAHGDGWPKPGDARLERAILDVRELSGAVHDGQRTFVAGSVNRTPTGELFDNLPPTGVNQRASLATLEHGAPQLSNQMDQMTQHPPGYYAVTAAVFKLVGAENWRYDRMLYFLRFLTGLAIAASVPFCIYYATRDLTGRGSTAQAAAFLPLLIPQLGFVGGAVNNDGLTIATASVLAALLVRVMTAGPTTRRLVLVAVAAGAVCWMKGTGLTLLPAIPLALAIAYWRTRGDGGVRGWIWPFVRNTAWVLGLTFVLGGWWWALNLVRYGRIQPAAYETPAVNGPVLSLGDFANVFQARVSSSFFGDVGLLEAPMPTVFTRTLTFALLAFLVVGLWPHRRWGERAVFVLSIGLTAGTLFATTYAGHRVTHNLPGLQGRYLFVLLVPLLVLVAVGLDRVLGLLRVPSRWLLFTVPVVGVAVTAVGLLLGFRLYYLVDGQSIGRALDVYLGWSAWSWTIVAGLAAAMVLCCVVLAYMLGRTGGRVAADDAVADGGALGRTRFAGAPGLDAGAAPFRVSVPADSAHAPTGAAADR